MQRERCSVTASRGYPIILSEVVHLDALPDTPTRAAPPPRAQIVPNFRVRTNPVLGPTPALFGMAAAGYILCELGNAPFDGEPLLTLTGLQYDRAMERLAAREWEAYGTEDGVAVDRDDVSALLAWGLQFGPRRARDCARWGI